MSIRIIDIPQWDLKAAAQALEMSYPQLVTESQDGRMANRLVSLWLANNGYTREKDGKSGFLLLRGDRVFRLRFGSDDLEFSPSSTRGMGRSFSKSEMIKEKNLLDGFIVGFTSEMPFPVLYELEHAYAQKLQAAALLDSHWSGKAKAIQKQIESDLRRERQAAIDAHPILGMK